MAEKKSIGKKITESAEEVDVLLDDMAILSKQMKEGKRLYSEEELQQKVQDEVQEAIEDAGIDTPVVIPEATIDDWINGDDDPVPPAGEQTQEQPDQNEAGSGT